MTIIIRTRPGYVTIIRSHEDGGVLEERLRTEIEPAAGAGAKQNRIEHVRQWLVRGSGQAADQPVRTSSNVEIRWLDNDDDGEGISWPGIVAGESVVVARGFKTFKHLQDAIPELGEVVEKLRSHHSGKPHFVLTVGDAADIDATLVESVRDALHDSGVKATVVVDPLSGSKVGR